MLPQATGGGYDARVQQLSNVLGLAPERSWGSPALRPGVDLGRGKVEGRDLVYIGRLQHRSGCPLVTRLKLGQVTSGSPRALFPVRAGYGTKLSLRG